MKRTCVCGLVLSLMVFCGCIATLHGEGSVEIGFVSSNMLVIKHRATPSAANPDGDSQAKLDVDPLVENLIDLGVGDQPEVEPDGEQPNE